MLKYSYFLIKLSIMLIILQYFFVLNTSASFPPGIYFKTHNILTKGDLVLFCPPDKPIFKEALQRGFLDAGLCPAGTEYMIKSIVAWSGDYIEITESDVKVSGFSLANSKRQIMMKHGLGNYSYNLNASDVLLMSPHSFSFDGRYFGTISADSIITPIIPLYLWQE